MVGGPSIAPFPSGDRFRPLQPLTALGFGEFVDDRVFAFALRRLNDAAKLAAAVWRCQAPAGRPDVSALAYLLAAPIAPGHG